MFNSEGKLDIFEQFVIDTDLPKYKRRRERVRAQQSLVEHAPVSSEEALRVQFGSNSGTEAGSEEFNLVLGNGLASVSRRQFFNAGNGVIISNPPSFWMKVKQLFRKPQSQPATPQRQVVESEITIEEFFKHIKSDNSKLDEKEIIAKRAAGYKALVERALKTGQRAMAEKLALGLEVTKAETALLSLNKVQYVTEAKIVEFVKKAPKGVRLDWIKNFTAPVPDDVFQAKEQCDEVEAFDNYVVLHYDPGLKSWAETHADKVEAAKKKDPILFGVIAGSRKCYYVGDWINEFCDLTLDKMAEALGSNPVQNIPPDLTVAYVEGK